MESSNEIQFEVLISSFDLFRDLNSLKKIILSYQPSAIIHLAGLQVPFCAANPALGARVNVEGTINILEIAKEVNIKRTVYASRR